MPRKVPFDQPPVHFVERDEVDVARAKVRQHRAQEVRCDFQVPVGLEFGVRARADVMQHENGAGAGEDRPQQVMGPAEVQRF
jgi:hypothetical protein